MVFGVAAQRVMSRDRAGVCPGDWTGLVCARINCMEKIPKSALLLMPFAYYHLGFRGSFSWFPALDLDIDLKIVGTEP